MSESIKRFFWKLETTKFIITERKLSCRGILRLTLLLCAVAEVHDIDGGLDKFREILEAQDFLVVANQSKELKGSQLYNVFAVRDSSETTE